MIPQTILDHWFSPKTQPWWFAKSDTFDAEIRARFADIWRQMAVGELSHWRTTTCGRLAEIITLDQFSRNLHRGSPLAFAQDGMSLVLAQEAIKQPDFPALRPAQAPIHPPIADAQRKRRSSTLPPWISSLATQSRTSSNLSANTKPSSIASAATRTVTPSLAEPVAWKRPPSCKSLIHPSNLS